MSEGGFIEKYKRYILQRTDCCEIYPEIIGYALLAEAIGRKPIMKTPDCLYTNLWVMLLGPSTISRKSTNIKLGKKIVPTGASGSSILPDIYTQEALVQNLSDLPEAHSIGFYQECGGLLKQMGSKTYQMGLDDLMCDLYDCPDDFKKDLKSGKCELEKVYINLIWATTKKKFFRVVDVEDFDSGFLPRFLIVFNENTEIGPEGELTEEHIEDEMEAKEALYQIYRKFRFEEFCFVPDKGCYDVVFAWEVSKESECPAGLDEDIWNAIVGRMKDYLWKFGALIEVDEMLAKVAVSTNNKISIKWESINKAINIINNLLNMLIANVLLITRNTFVKQMDKVKDYIGRAGEEGATKSYLLQSTHFKTTDLTEILRTLKDSGEIIIKNKRFFLND